MAKTQKIDPAAAKARKQKIMLGVIGAVLVVIAVIQVPKLMNSFRRSSTPAAAAPADTTAGSRHSRLLRRRPEPLPQSRRCSPARP